MHTLAPAHPHLPWLRRRLRPLHLRLLLQQRLQRRRHLQQCAELCAQHQYHRALCLRARPSFRRLLDVLHACARIHETVHLDYGDSEYCSGNCDSGILLYQALLLGRGRVRSVQRICDHLLHQLVIPFPSLLSSNSHLSSF